MPFGFSRAWVEPVFAPINDKQEKILIGGLRLWYFTLKYVRKTVTTFIHINVLGLRLHQSREKFIEQFTKPVMEGRILSHQITFTRKMERYPGVAQPYRAGDITTDIGFFRNRQRLMKLDKLYWTMVFKYTSMEIPGSHRWIGRVHLNNTTDESNRLTSEQNQYHILLQWRQ